MKLLRSRGPGAVCTAIYDVSRRMREAANTKQSEKWRRFWGCGFPERKFSLTCKKGVYAEIRAYSLVLLKKYHGSPILSMNNFSLNTHSWGVLLEALVSTTS